MNGAKLAATRDGALSTFLLEMALDEARLRERFATVLLQWRTLRGHGDPERFTQQEAARELDAGYRTYQHWEAGDHLPRRWSDVERVLEVIGVEPGVLFEGGQSLPSPAIEFEHSRDSDLGEILDRLDRHHDEVMARLGEIQEQIRVTAATEQQAPQPAS